MSEMACPECGKSFSRSDRESARNSVIGHMSRAHDGIGYQKAVELIDLHSSDSGDEPGSMESSSSMENRGSIEDGQKATDGGNPAFKAPESERTFTEQEEQSSRDDEAAECPHCGETIDNWGEIDQGEIRGCGSCGGRFKKQ